MMMLQLCLLLAKHPRRGMRHIAVGVIYIEAINEAHAALLLLPNLGRGRR